MNINSFRWQTRTDDRFIVWWIQQKILLNKGGNQGL